jgi:hypothetical protein
MVGIANKENLFRPVRGWLAKELPLTPLSPKLLEGRFWVRMLVDLQIQRSLVACVHRCINACASLIGIGFEEDLRGRPIYEGES